MKHQDRPLTLTATVWQLAEWPAVFLLFGISFGLGYVGFGRYLDAGGLGSMFPDRVYRTIQLYILQADLDPLRIPWELDWARFLAPALAFYTAAKAIAVVFRNELTLFRARLFRGHVVICGLGRKGLLLARGFRRRNVPVLIIERDEENDYVKQCIDEGIPVLIGDAASADVLRRARAHKAAHVIAVSGEDGTNAEIAVLVRALRAERGRHTVSCHVDVFDAELCALLRERESAAGSAEHFRLDYFNIFEIASRALLQEHPAFDAHSLAEGRKPRILLVGLGRLGESLLVEIARMWWYRHRVDRKRLRVVVVDKQAEAKHASLCLKYPRLEEACDVTVQQMDVLGPDFQRGDFLFDRKGACAVTAAYVCVDNDSVALTAGLAVNRNLRDRAAASDSPVPIVIRMLRDEGLAKLLRSDTVARDDWSNPHSFGLLDRACRPDEILRGTNEIIARAIHNASPGDSDTTGRSGDNGGQGHGWDALPDSAKATHRRRADDIVEALRHIGCILIGLADWNAPLFTFTPEEIELLTAMAHERHMEGLVLFEPAPPPDTLRRLPAFLAEAGFGIKRLSVPSCPRTHLR
jgi:hypothetical protein